LARLRVGRRRPQEPLHPARGDLRQGVVLEGRQHVEPQVIPVQLLGAVAQLTEVQIAQPLVRKISEGTGRAELAASVPVAGASQQLLLEPATRGRCGRRLGRTRRSRPSASRKRVSAVTRPPRRRVLTAPKVPIGVRRRPAITTAQLVPTLVVPLHPLQPGLHLADPEAKLATHAEAARTTALAAQVVDGLSGNL